MSPASTAGASFVCVLGSLCSFHHALSNSGGLDPTRTHRVPPWDPRSRSYNLFITALASCGLSRHRQGTIRIGWGLTFPTGRGGTMHADGRRTSSLSNISSTLSHGMPDDLYQLSWASRVSVKSCAVLVVRQFPKHMVCGDRACASERGGSQCWMKRASCMARGKI